jgi:hypothetical protein
MTTETSSTNNILYEETWFVPWSPLTFFLPMFYHYGVIVTNNTLTFGYGYNKPNISGSLTANTIHLDTDSSSGSGGSGDIGNDTMKVIEKGSIVIGNASFKDNLLTFGGWGIRYNFLTKTTAYNANNGQYIEFTCIEKKSNHGNHGNDNDNDNDNDVVRHKYRFVSHNVYRVASLLCGEDYVDTTTIATEETRLIHV